MRKPKLDEASVRPIVEHLRLPVVLRALVVPALAGSVETPSEQLNLVKRAILARESIVAEHVRLDASALHPSVRSCAFEQRVARERELMVRDIEASAVAVASGIEDNIESLVLKCILKRLRSDYVVLPRLQAAFTVFIEVPNAALVGFARHPRALNALLVRGLCSFKPTDEQRENEQSRDEGYRPHRNRLRLVQWV